MSTPVNAPYKARQRNADYRATRSTIVTHKNPALVGKEINARPGILRRFIGAFAKAAEAEKAKAESGE